MSSQTQTSQRRRSKRLASKTPSISESNPINVVTSTNSFCSSTSTRSSFRNTFGHCISVDAPELDNKYIILDMIGYGGYATVYKARQLRTNRYVAIKRVAA